MIVRFVFLLICFGSTTSGLAASYRTQNFLVTAPSQDIATRVGERAELWRKELANSWIGTELPAWNEPCSIRTYIRDSKGGTGETSFEFENGRPKRARMIVLGPLAQVLDSLLPHEITHLVLATHFGRRLPPWIDEGASTIVEATSEREKLRKAVRNILSSDRQLTLAQLFAAKEYPHDIVPLYTQGHALSSYLINRGGKKKFLQFVRDGLALADQVASSEQPTSKVETSWAQAVREHYGFMSLAGLESQWLAWIGDASFLSAHREEFLIAANMLPNAPSRSGLIMQLVDEMGTQA